MEIFVSNYNVDKDVLIDCLQQKSILCNVYPFDSIVYSKKLKKNVIQEGFKVEIFNYTTKDKILIPLWDILRVNLNIHCIYVKDEYFEGCITQLPVYIKYCKKNNIKPLKCSEYNLNGDKKIIDDKIRGRNKNWSHDKTYKY